MTTDTHAPETSNPTTAVAVACMHVMSNSSRQEFDAIFTSDAFNRESDQEPPEARGTGPAAFFASSRWLQDAFSELAWEIHDIARDGDLVAIHATMSGRQTGSFVSYRPDGTVLASFAPTGRTFAVTQSHWLRIKDGKVAEHWANRDDLGMGIQLGWGPPAA
jgi:predicted ester cyclase